ncbi:MAG: divergent PAP2 family protein [Spirochaetales bacterium]|jgi:acid phosphatase family membrane protein YuiD|nr:divergent PAP2 family protein [Spirochaetales bacterium]
MGDFPFALIASVSAQILCQAFKAVFYSVRERRFAPCYFTSPGGVPSAHSAFVTALSVAVGMRNGFFSDIFAVCFVFAAIVVYDAFRLRGAVGKHAELLNRLTARHFPGEHENLSEMVGHSPPEIITGIAAGGIFSFIVTTVLINTF